MQTKPSVFLSFIIHWFLLFCGTTGCIYSLITAFDLQVYNEQIFISILVFSLAVTGLFFLKKGLLPVFLGMWALFLMSILLFLQTLVNGAIAVFLNIGAQYSQYFDWGLENYRSTLKGDELTHAMTVFFLFLSFCVALCLGFAVLHRKSLLFGGLVCAVCLVPCFILVVTPPHIVPILGVALCLIGCVFTKHRSLRTGGKVLLLVLPLTGLLLWTLLFLSPPESYTQSPVVTQWMEHFISLGNQMFPGGDFNGSPLYPVGGDVHATAGFNPQGVDLSFAGPRKYSNKTIMKVNATAAGALYLRCYSMAYYSGQAWGCIDKEDLNPAFSSWTVVQDLSPTAFHPLTALKSHLLPAPAQEVSIDTGNNLSMGLYVPYGCDTVDTSIGTPHLDDYIRAKASAYSVSYTPYDIHSNQWIKNDSFYGELSAYTALVNTAYTGVPDDLRSGLEPYLAQLNLGNNATREQMVESVRNFVSSCGSYDINTPYTPPGEDFVLYFLNQSKRGYCMHYATTAAMMLRCLNIPTRYVGGYAINLSPQQTNLWMNVTDRQAHAWVEVYFDDIGWVPIDPTPAAATDIPLSPVSGAATSSSTSAPSSSPSSQPSAPSTAEDLPAGQSHLPTQLLWLLLIPAGAGLLLLYGMLWKWIHHWKSRHTNPTSAVLSLWPYVNRLLQEGVPISPDVKEIALKGRFSAHPLTEEEREKVISLITRGYMAYYPSLSPLKKISFFCLKGLGW